MANLLKQKLLLGFGTNEAQMKDLINDVKVLMAEYKRPTKEKENEK